MILGLKDTAIDVGSSIEKLTKNHFFLEQLHEMACCDQLNKQHCTNCTF